jgi:hypothetical protein
MKKKYPPEAWEQEQIFRWARTNQIQFPELQLLNGSLNGFKLGTGQSVKAKKQGMRKGYPDIFFPIPNLGYHGLFIELKKVKGGSISKEQKVWLKKLTDQGYLAVVEKGYINAINRIKEYLGI